MSYAMLQTLRIVHIVVGAFWVGAVLFAALLLLPSLRAIGPAASAVLEQLIMVRRLPIYMAGFPILTVLSGLGLYWNDSAGFSGMWMRSGPGRTFGLGGALALAAAIIGGVVAAPTGKRLGEMAAAARAGVAPPSPEEQVEMQRLQSRLHGAMKIVAVLLVLAASAMAVARYVPS